MKLSVVLLSILPPFIAYFMCKYDTTYFILCKLSVETSFSAHIIRFVILAVVSLEGVRSGTLISFVILVVLARLHKFIKVFVQLKSRPKAFRMYANMVGLEVGKVQNLLNGTAYVTFTTFFWVIVGFVWILVRNTLHKYLIRCMELAQSVYSLYLS